MSAPKATSAKLSAQVVRFKRNWRSVIPQFLLTLIFVFIGIYITKSFPWLSINFPIEISDFKAIIKIPVVLVIFPFLIIRPIVKLFDTYIEITKHHLRIFHGQISLIRNSQEFAFEDLLGVQVSQSILERILGVGTIEVGSKTQNIQLQMGGIWKPQKYANLIARLIDRARLVEKSQQKNKV